MMMIACRRCRALQIASLNYRVFRVPTVNITLIKSSFWNQFENIKFVQNLSMLRSISSSANIRNSYINLEGAPLSIENYAANLENHADEVSLSDDYHEIKSSEENHDDDHRGSQFSAPVPQAADEKNTTKKKKNKKPKSSKETEELKRIELGKAGTIEKSLKSYVSMCFYHGFNWKVLPALKHYQKELNLLQNFQVYNIALKGAARHGEWAVFQELRALMKTNNVPSTIDTYAASFTCLGACSSRNLLPDFTESTGSTNVTPAELAEKLILEMEANGMQISDIFEKCTFVCKEREMAIDGIRLARPHFVAQRTALPLDYSSKLLLKLNDRSIPKGMTPESPAHGVVSKEELVNLAASQLKFEVDGTIRIDSICKPVHAESQICLIDRIEKKWRDRMRSALERDLKMCKNQFFNSHPKSLHIYPYISSLTIDDYTELIVHELKMLTQLSESYSPGVHQMSRLLGVRVMKRVHTKVKEAYGVLDKIRVVYSQYCEKYLDPGADGQKLNPRQIWQKLMEENPSGPDISYREVVWPYPVLTSVGQFLYNIIINETKITVFDKDTKTESEVPAFFLVYRNRDMKLVKQLKPHPLLLKHFEESNRRNLSFDTNLVPMLSPPLPWYTALNGGYLASEVAVIRLAINGHQQMERIAEAPCQQMYPSLDSLNYLGSIPWRINTNILDLLIQIFNEGGDDHLEVPRTPNSLALPEPMRSDMTSQEKSQAMKLRKAFWRQRAEMYSTWCDTLYRLSLANHFRDKVFWLPNNMDFRGRVYPCPPHLTHLSSDMARSMLLFAQGKPLGKEGLDWLKTHLINLTGFKKRDPTSERLRYADEIMDEITDSALRPLTGNKWWTTSDEPWQTLAACMELTAAINSPDPYQYVSHLPIHQDGSCNGLQHYAALGRDRGGAESVNLAPSARPQDVYSSVAALVEKERIQDAEKGVRIAKILEGHVKRKVIKQTVMTTVYGVTRYGARQQILKQLKDVPTLSEDEAWEGAIYLADKTFHSLQEMFTAAKEIQDWFTDCAKLITKACGKNVEWVTPLGLPVVQPYSAFNPLQANWHYSTLRPNAMKQRNAFPPNFVHSLDSSHMMLTSLFCQRSDITFASVHDCFWTHACNVNIMNRICREQFVALHSEPILQDLSKYLIEKFGDCDLTKQDVQTKMGCTSLNSVLGAVPASGTFDLKEVLNSVYFFS